MTAILDTSFLVALANRRDANHTACLAVARTTHERLIIPQVVLPEASYLVEKYMGHKVMTDFISKVTAPSFVSEAMQGSDLARVVRILEQYTDLRLDFVDACIVALAERLSVSRVFTLDRRHFLAIHPEHIAAFEVLPA